MREVRTCKCSRRCVVRRWAAVGGEKPRAPKTDDASAGNAHLYNLSRARSRAVRFTHTHSRRPWAHQAVGLHRPRPCARTYGRRTAVGLPIQRRGSATRLGDSWRSARCRSRRGIIRGRLSRDRCIRRTRFLHKDGENFPTPMTRAGVRFEKVDESSWCKTGYRNNIENAARLGFVKLRR